MLHFFTTFYSYRCQQHYLDVGDSRGRSPSKQESSAALLSNTAEVNKNTAVLGVLATLDKWTHCLVYCMLEWTFFVLIDRASLCLHHTAFTLK